MTSDHLGIGLTVWPDERQLLYVAVNNASDDDLLMLEFDK